jgi:hypothetical protein
MILSVITSEPNTAKRLRASATMLPRRMSLVELFWKLWWVSSGNAMTGVYLSTQEQILH